MTQFVLSLLLAAGQLFAADAAKEPTPTTPAPFILPPSPTPQPPPPPPNTPVKLVAGTPYVVRLNAAAVVASPANMVRLCNKPEPVTLIDAAGNDTTYSGDKSVCIVSAKSTGPAELIIVSTADGSELARVQLDVGGVGPGPGPGPGPPNPLTATFQAAYTADGGGNVRDLNFLASLYTKAAPLAANQTGWKTNLEAATWLKGIEGNNLAATSLPKLREAIGAELMAALPPAQPADVNAISAELTKVGTALQGVK